MTGKTFYHLFFLSLLSCISPYEFESIDFERTLVIDASLTTETTAHFVRLSYTFEIDSSKNDPASNASVAFIDETGARTSLREATPGFYITDSTFFGIPGASYSLEVILADGTMYRSSEETMPVPAVIDSIYGRYITLPTDTDDTDMTGVQVFLDAHSEDPESQNFRYTYRDSYQVPVPFPSQYDWSGTGETFRIFERERPLGTCYRKSASTETMVATTRSLSENKVLEYPIRFINESSDDLAYQYIIEVTQFTISNDAYNFFRYLKESNEGAGSLSDRQLGSIRGNIIDVANPNNLVLGYFEVAGVSTVKKSFNYQQFLLEGIKTEQFICLPLEEGQDLGFGCVFKDQRMISIVEVLEEIVINPRTGDTTIVEETVLDYSDLDAELNSLGVTSQEACGYTYRIVDVNATTAFVSHESCSDCTLYGLLEPPSIWEE
ncbi:MAG: DUF4249 domain-containing protein [Cytophagales bacterium]|nr:DUF4249 domain-containing protein [Cytophagales bacterium]